MLAACHSRVLELHRERAPAGDQHASRVGKTARAHGPPNSTRGRSATQGRCQRALPPGRPSCSRQRQPRPRNAHLAVRHPCHLPLKRTEAGARLGLGGGERPCVPGAEGEVHLLAVELQPTRLPAALVLLPDASPVLPASLASRFAEGTVKACRAIALAPDRRAAGPQKSSAVIGCSRARTRILPQGFGLGGRRPFTQQPELEMEVPAGQDGIQRLLTAEQEAQAIVQQARQGGGPNV